MTAQLERQPRGQNSLVPADQGTKGILTYGHPCVLTCPMAKSKQKLWSLPGPWGHLLSRSSSVISTVG